MPVKPDLPARFERNVLSRKLIPSGRFVLVAVSGGLDSVALAHLVCRVADQHGWLPVLAHFNHQLRGEASDLDAQFVLELARQLGLRCVAGRGDVAGRSQRERISLEMAGRAERHEFLAATCAELEIDTVALAHHADDQVELFLMRLLRGSGPEGLSGMDWESRSPVSPRVRLVRPLLDCTRAELAAYAQSEGIQWREDASNLCLEHERNRIRHEVIPLLASAFTPGVVGNILRVQEILRVQQDFVRGSADAWAAHKSAPPFETLHPALQREWIRSELVRLGATPDFPMIESLRLAPDTPITIRPGVCVRCSADGTLSQRNPAPAPFRKETLECDLSAPKGIIRFGNVELSWKRSRVSARAPIRPRAGREKFDAAKVGSSIRLRHWQPGDRFQLIGSSAPAKLQDLFMNAKVPRSARRDRIVATSADGAIFWVEGLRIGERFKLDKQSRAGLEWSWRRV